MSDKLFFNGIDAYGELDTVVTLPVGDTVEFEFAANSNDKIVLTSNSDGTDQIEIVYDSSTTVDYTIRSGGSTSTNTNVTVPIFDGEEHSIVVTRATSTTMSIAVDGGTASTMNASGDFDVLYIMRDVNGSAYTTGAVGGVVISTHTYPTDGGDGITLEDTSGGGNDIALSNVNVANLTEWEWVGEIYEVDRTYQIQGVISVDRRNEATRRRVVKGYPMTSPIITQAGETLTSVTAYNGVLATTVTPIQDVATIDCDEERMQAIHGAEFYYQLQKWVSWSKDAVV